MNLQTSADVSCPPFIDVSYRRSIARKKVPRYWCNIIDRYPGEGYLTVNNFKEDVRHFATRDNRDCGRAREWWFRRRMFCNVGTETNRCKNSVGRYDDMVTNKDSVVQYRYRNEFGLERKKEKKKKQKILTLNNWKNVRTILYNWNSFLMVSHSGKFVLQTVVYR